jgi:hypothetical protein
MTNNARALFGQAQVAAGLARRIVTEAGVEYVADGGQLDGVLTQTRRSTQPTDC